MSEKKSKAKSESKTNNHLDFLTRQERLNKLRIRACLDAAVVSPLVLLFASGRLRDLPTVLLVILSVIYMLVVLYVTVQLMLPCFYIFMDDNTMCKLSFYYARLCKQCNKQSSNKVK